MLVVKKFVLCLAITLAITPWADGKIEAKKTPISLQEAVTIALKDNVNIQIADQGKKEKIIFNNIANFQLWAAQAIFSFNQQNIWTSPTRISKLAATPVCMLQLNFKSLAHTIFQTKINLKQNFVEKLVAKKAVEQVLAEVIRAYYALSLAQKKCELSNNCLKVAYNRFKIEEEKLKIGLISRLDYLDAQLALKEVKLTLLERQENLKVKQRGLNLILGKSLTETTQVESNISIQPIWDIKSITKEKVIDLDSAIQATKVEIAATALSRAKAYPLSCIGLSGGFRSNGYFMDLQDKQWKNDLQPNKWMATIGLSIDMINLLLMPKTIQKAKIGLNHAKLLLQEKKAAIESYLEDKKWKYEDTLAVYKVIQEQAKISKERLIFVKEKYRLNQVKLLELHEAEEAAQKIEIKLIEQACKVKDAEFALYKLVGMFSEKLFRS